jgi:hypothetical protein
VTGPTPSIFWRSGTTVRFSWSPRACWSFGEVTASTTVGRSFVEPDITCGSTAWGSWLEARLTACWMSATRDLVSDSPNPKLAMTVALPSLDVEVTLLTPSTALMAFSSGSATCFSTTSGEAPW